MTHLVRVSGALRDALGGADMVEIEADNIRDLLNRLSERYPAFAAQVDAGVAVSIDGQIFRDNRSQPIDAGAEVFLMPRLEGG
ncbi:MAG: MoaD/ThiS family protein [Pseudomonadota bacterium]